jgi:hypothetical protein
VEYDVLEPVTDARTAIGHSAARPSRTCIRTPGEPVVEMSREAAVLHPAAT